MSAATIPGAAASHATASGDGDITLIIEREAPALLAYFARRVTIAADAADLLGELYLVVWRRRTAIPDDATAARMWLYGVARKVLGRHRRTTARRTALALRLRDELAARPAATRADEGTDADVRAKIAALAPLDREIIQLAYWEGFSFVEIAAILRMPAATVRSRHARAKANLREALQAEAPAGPG